MSKKKTTKAVAKKDQNAMVDFDFSADVGGGFEGADKDSFAIPFLRVLQKGSPQVDEADAAFIENAKPGMFFNSVTGQLFDEVTFIPCHFQRRFIRWAPRGSDAGFKGEYMPEDVEEMIDKGEIVQTEEGLLFPTDDGELSRKKSDRMVDTRTHFGLVETEDGLSQVAFPLASTQIKKSKQLMSVLNEAKIRSKDGLVTPPTWMNRIKITTAVESNDEGSWYGIKIKPEGFIESKDTYDLGKAFHDSVSKGEAKANFASEEQV